MPQKGDYDRHNRLRYPDWMSNGEVVSTDETLSLTADHVPYIRAHLWNDAGGETSTQSFGIGPT